MRKKIALSFAVLFGILLVIFLLGPRVTIDKTIKNRQVPRDPNKLEAYLTQSESRFKDIRPNTEKKIIWADPTKKQQTPLSIVYVHGFSATRQETAPLSDRLAKSLGANLYYTRLAGHGRTGAALAKRASVNRWINDMVEAYQIGTAIGKKVIVIAGSTGATLATWLATEFDSQHVLGYVFISPNFAPRKKTARILLLPWGEAIATAIVGPYRGWKPQSKLNAKYWTYRYPTKALLPMMGLIKMTDAINMRDFRTPLLIIYSPKDKIISAKRIEEVFPTIGAKTKKLLPFNESQDRGHHVLAGDAISPKSTDAVLQHIQHFVTPLLPKP
jgi:esterase/lipase